MHGACAAGFLLNKNNHEVWNLVSYITLQTSTKDLWQ